MSLSFALITPSFAPDFERCRLLVESVQKHVAAHVHHYLIVDQRDARLFGQLRAARTHIVIKQDMLPGRFAQLPLTRKWWLDLDGRVPVRGWILQQITKLAVPRVSDHDVFVFIDSDAFFVRPYDPRNALREERVPMFRELLPSDDYAPNVRWHRAAAQLFGLPEQAGYAQNYVTQVVTWRRENVLRMHARIEATTGRPWQQAISACSTVSEYTLYGVFCEQILGENAHHYWQEQMDTLCSWGVEPLDEAQVRKFGAELAPHQSAVMISAKSHTPVATIRRAFQL